MVEELGGGTEELAGVARHLLCGLVEAGFTVKPGGTTDAVLKEAW